MPGRPERLRLRLMEPRGWVFPEISRERKIFGLIPQKQEVFSGPSGKHSNSLLEERRRRFEAGEPEMGFSAMCRELTVWRRRSSALETLNAQSLQVTARRVDLAFDAFFRRVKAGGKPGYPRFKSIRRFAGWGYKTHGDGWRLNLKPDKHGAVHLSGIGTVRMRGKGRFTGKPKTAEVVRRRGKWYLSVTFNVEADSLVPLAGARWETTNRYDKTGFIGLLRRGYPCLQT